MKSAPPGLGKDTAAISKPPFGKGGGRSIHNQRKLIGKAFAQFVRLHGGKSLCPCEQAFHLPQLLLDDGLERPALL